MNTLRWMPALILFTWLGGATAATAQEAAARTVTIGVLPFKALNPNADTDWIGPASAETLTSKLGVVQELVVVERAQMVELLGEQDFQKLDVTDPATARQTGRVIGAERLVVGSFTCAGEDVQFNARVIDVATSEILQTANVTAKLKHIFDGINELADAVIESFQKKVVIVDARPTVVEAPPAERIVVTEERRTEVHREAQTTPEAYQAYGRGLVAPSYEEQLSFFNLAIKSDSSFFYANLAMGDTYSRQGQFELAIGEYDRVIAKNPRCAHAFYGKGKAYEGLKRPKLAAAAYRTFVKLAPSKTSKVVDKIKKKLRDSGEDRDEDDRPKRRIFRRNDKP